MTSRDDQRLTIAQAFVSAYAERDWPRAVAAVDRHWTTLIFTPEAADALFATVREATEDVLHRHPRAALIGEGIGRLPVGSVAVTMPGNAARVDEALRTGAARELVEIAALAMIARRTAGLPREAVAIATASRALVRASATTRFSPAADLAAYWHLQAGQAALHAGDLSQATLDLQHAWTFRETDITGYAAASATPFLALIAELCGDSEASSRWQHEVDRLAVAGRDLIEWDTMERPRLVARLLAAADRLDHEEGARLTDLLLGQLSFDELWSVTLFAVTRHLVNVGETARAEQLLDAALELHPGPAVPGSLHDSFVALARADLALGSGRATALAGLLAESGGAGDAGLDALYGLHLALLTGDLPGARLRAVIAERAPGQARVARESRLLRTAIDLHTGHPAPDRTTYGPHLRRAASLLPPALNEALRGGIGEDVPASHEAMATTDPGARLTAGETRVLQALAASGSLAEVADRLFISRNTLKSHLRALYRKLGATSRDEAVALGAKRGLLGGDDLPG